MSLTDEVRAVPRLRWTRQEVDAHLGPEEAAELDALLADPDVPPGRIYKALRKRGITVSSSGVTKWASEARA